MASLGIPCLSEFTGEINISAFIMFLSASICVIYGKRELWGLGDFNLLSNKVGYQAIRLTSV
jgi:hypothetical protein